MKVSDRLSQIENRTDYSYDSSDIRDLHIAVRAVLDLHRPVSVRTCHCCKQCRECGQPFPCQTYTAIDATLGEGEP